MSKHMFRGIDAETDAMIDEIERKASTSAVDDELRDVVRREVVKAQHGTIGELTDAIVATIQARDEQQKLDAILNYRTVTVVKGGIYLGKCDTESNYYLVEIDADSKKLKLIPCEESNTYRLKVSIQTGGAKTLLSRRISNYIPLGKYVRIDDSTYQHIEELQVLKNKGKTE